MALRTALALERPWPTMVTPATPSSGAPPYSEASMRRRKRRITSAGRQRSEARRDGAGQLGFGELDQPLADLQRDVAGEAVAHDDVRLTAVNIPCLDVADERQRRGLEQRWASRVSSLPFRRFFTNRQQPDARRLDAEGNAREDVAHHPELQEVLRPAFDARAHVKQDRGPFPRRDGGGERRSIDCRAACRKRREPPSPWRRCDRR